VFKQIIHVFVYICVPFLFYCLVKFIVHCHKCMTKKNFQWHVTHDACFGTVLQMNTLFSRMQFSHSLSIHCLWLMTHVWAPMSCSSAVRKKNMWAESFKKLALYFHGLRDMIRDTVTIFASGHIFPLLSCQWQLFLSVRNLLVVWNQLD